MIRLSSSQEKVQRLLRACCWYMPLICLCRKACACMHPRHQLSDNGSRSKLPQNSLGHVLHAKKPCTRISPCTFLLTQQRTKHVVLCCRHDLVASVLVAAAKVWSTDTCNNAGVWFCRHTGAISLTLTSCMQQYASGADG